LKILIDESLPRYLKQPLKSHQVFTVQEMGWTGITNSVLLGKANGEFDVLLTADKNLRHQQNLSRLTLSVVVFPSNRLSVVKALVARLQSILPLLKRGEILELD
jgi:predicted nuclease of predicted toxin-antitoxin system